MPKFYVISDVHSAYTHMKKALDDAGFNPKNPDHFLISCGDNFDRMDESQQVLDYLMSVPNKILILGNHELLIQSMCQRKFPYSNDFSNGTHKTVCSLAPDAKEFDEACDVAIDKLKPLFNQMVNYFETAHYIFVHSYLPLLKNVESSVVKYNPNWRNASDKEWEDAMWGNPFRLHRQFGHNFDKTVVCGHWHTSWPRAYFNGEEEWEDDADFSPYYMDGLIGIDACCAASHKINVIVLEDEFL